MNLFVISLINSDDEAGATYSESESEDGNDNGIRRSMMMTSRIYMMIWSMMIVIVKKRRIRTTPLIFNFI